MNYATYGKETQGEERSKLTQNGLYEPAARESAGLNLFRPTYPPQLVLSNLLLLLPSSPYASRAVLRLDAPLFRANFRAPCTGGFLQPSSWRRPVETELLAVNLTTRTSQRILNSYGKLSITVEMCPLVHPGFLPEARA